MNPAPSTESLPKFARRDWLLFGGFALLKIVVHFATDGAGAYGYFRDELYYLDCARHLDWGYVDQPPLSIFALWATRALLGDSLLAIRLPVALCGAATLWLAGLMAREMGGGRFAQALTCLGVAAAPIFLATGSFFSMNVFDQFFWALAAWLVARLLRTDDARIWLWLGLVVGLGLENKCSMGFFAGAFVAAMALTPLRRQFGRWQLWAGGALAAALFAPHVVWQMRHGWPTLEFMHNARLYKNLPLTLRQFAGGQLTLAGPLQALLWVAGLLYGLMAKRGRAFAAFSLAYFILFAVFYATNGKVYYLSPAYPMLFALGSLWWEARLASRRWAQAAALALLAASGVALAPLALPILPPPAFLRYQDALGIRAPQQERAHGGLLPQHLGDRLGWPEFAAMVAAAYGRLDPADRANCAIFTSNYGEAGAIDLFGPRYGLPPAISGHMSHFLWGPGAATGDVMLVYWGERDELAKLFREVTEVARFRDPFVMERQNDRPLFLCRGLQAPLAALWSQFKIYR